MGLNDSYSQIKGQILLMEPLPSINKVYSLLIQEERQRRVGSCNTYIESTALAVKGFNSISFFSGGKNSKGKDRPFCTHCGKLGHIVEKCFKLHGFPPRFKPKGKTSMVNQVGVQEDLAENNQSVTNANQFPFTKEQCQQFLVMLGNQMQAAQFNMGNNEVHMAGNVINSHSDSQAAYQASVSQSNNVLNMLGMTLFEGITLRQSVFSAQVMNRIAFNGDTWVIDIGATDYIVHSIHLFTNFTAISTNVELPNGETAMVPHIGSISHSATLVLHNVLCVLFFFF